MGGDCAPLGGLGPRLNTNSTSRAKQGPNPCLGAAFPGTGSSLTWLESRWYVRGVRRPRPVTACRETSSGANVFGRRTDCRRRRAGRGGRGGRHPADRRRRVVRGHGGG